MSILSIKNLEKEYTLEGQKIPALQGISLDIYEGEFLIIMGPSGSGKSTLINILGTMDRQAKGKLLYGKTNLLKAKPSFLSKYRKRVVGIVFQNFNLIGNTSVSYNLHLPSWIAGLMDKQKQHMADIISYFNLQDKLEAEVDILSQGEQQQVAIARSIINDPAIILADEPTGNLDSETGEHTVEMFHKLNKEKGKTIVFVTHNPDFKKYADRIVYLADGKIESIEVINDKSGQADNNMKDIEDKGSRSSFTNLFHIGLLNTKRYSQRYILLAFGLGMGLSFIAALILLITAIYTNFTTTVFPVQNTQVLLVERQHSLVDNSAGKPLDTQALSDLQTISGITTLYPVKNIYGSMTGNGITTPLYAQTGSPVKDHQDFNEHFIAGEYFTTDTDKAIILTMDQIKGLGITSPEAAIGEDVIIHPSTTENITAGKQPPVTLKIAGILDPNIVPQHNILPAKFYGTYSNDPVLTYDDIFVYTANADMARVIGQQIDSLGFNPVYVGERSEPEDNGGNAGATIIYVLAAGGLFTLLFNLLNVMILLFLTRTRETGILKVLGARLKDVITIYFTEGLLLGVITGVGGLVFTIIDVMFINLILSQPVMQNGTTILSGTQIQLDVISLGTVCIVSILVGIVSMTYPVLRTSRTSITQALNRD